MGTNGFRVSTFAAVSLLSLAAAAAASRPAPNHLQTLLAKGRVAWWPAEKDAHEIVSRNDGRIIHRVTYVRGVKGLAWRFDGKKSGIFVRDTPALAFTGAFSISLWFNAERLPGGEVAVSQLFFRGDDRPGLDPYSLHIQPDGRIGFSIDSGKGSDVASSPDEAPVGKWTHVLGAFDPERQLLLLYVDGMLVAKKKTTFSPMAVLDPAQTPGIGIGNTQHPDAFNRPLVGAIDEVQVWSRVLTAKEVAYLARQAP